MSDTNSQTQPQEATTRTRRTAAQMAEARGELPISDSLLARIVEVTEQRIATRPNPMSLDTFEQIEAFAERAARSLMVPKDYQSKPDNIIIAVMKGKELGMPPIQALESIAIVNGRCSIWGAMVEALCYASGLVEDHEEHFEGTEGTDDFTAICTVKRKGIASPKVGRFSQRDARHAGLYGQSVHGKYPRRMMQWRAKHPAFTDAFPDVLKGIAIRELESEDAVATPGWTMPVPEKGWFTSKPQARTDGWDDTWFAGVVQKLAAEPNAWKWLDLLVACLRDAPTLRDVEEIGDLPMVLKVRETAPEEGKQAIDAGFTAAREGLTDNKEKAATPAVNETTVSATTVTASKPETRDTAAGVTAPEEIGSSPVSSGATPFSAWLVDGEGNEIPDDDGVIEAYTDPVAFAKAYKNAEANEFPGTIELFRRANQEALVAAQIASNEVAAILAGPKLPAPTQPAQDIAAPMLPMEMPIDPAVVFAPPMKPTKADMDKYKDGLKLAAAASATPDALNHAIDVNEPVYDKFPPSHRLACKAIIEARQKEMSPPPPRDAAPRTLYDLAQGMLRDIAALDSVASVNAWRNYASVVAELERLRVGDPDWYRQVLVAADNRRDKLDTPPGPRGIADAMIAGLKACTTATAFNTFQAAPDNLKNGKFLMEGHPEIWAEVRQAAATQKQVITGGS